MEARHGIIGPEIHGKVGVMKAVEAIVEILKREGVECVIGYPVNHVLEFAARWNIRPIIVRQERIGLHMADALSRLSSGKKVGVFAMQHGPGAENAYGGVAQAFGEGVPVLVLPMGYARRLAHVRPNFNSTDSMAHVAKTTEPVTSANEVPNIMRRAFTQLRNGRGGPCVVEIPTDVFEEEMTVELDYTPVCGTRYGPDPDAVTMAADILVTAERPVVWAGQGVHYAKAWPQLQHLAELLAVPVATSLGGKSAFPEDHPLSLGAGGNPLRPIPIYREDNPERSQIYVRALRPFFTDDPELDIFGNPLNAEDELYPNEPGYRIINPLEKDRRTFNDRQAQGWEPRGLFVPSAPLRAALEQGHLDTYNFNFTEQQRAFNRGAAQQDEGDRDE